MEIMPVVEFPLTNPERVFLQGTAAFFNSRQTERSEKKKQPFVYKEPECM